MRAMLISAGNRVRNYFRTPSQTAALLRSLDLRIRIEHAKSPVFPTIFVNRYRIKEFIGQGGTANVFLAEDMKQQNKQVAIKVAHFDGIKYLKNEAKALRQLNHQNIIGFYGIKYEDGVVYSVLEYVEGESLESLAEKGALSLPKILDIISQVCHALKYLKEQGFAHFEVKPKNIMVTKEGLAKLIDFGCARLFPAFVESGTLSLLPPEIREGKKADHRSDIYYLGMSLSIAINKTAAENIPDTLRQVISKMTANNLLMRYNSYEEILKDLEEVKKTFYIGEGKL